jgi:hypothetical protein
MVKALCIYHGNCDDGFGAAYCVHLALRGDVELYPGVYNKAPPVVVGRDVILVDFSYKRDVLQEMGKSARSVLVLDHHKTAAEDLRGYPSASSWPEHLNAEWPDGMIPIHATFDMDRSGAGMAWDFFHPHGTRPLFVDYLEDRDLWRKKLPGGDEFTFALRSHPQTLEAWGDLFGSYTASTRGRRDVERLIADGHPIARFYKRQVEAIKAEAYSALVDLGGGEQTVIRACNAPYAFASEVAGEIVTPDVAFGASYFRRADGRWQYSLRAKPGVFDVSKFAQEYGGGGHAAAAGFDVGSPVHVRLSAEDVAARRAMMN